MYNILCSHKNQNQFCFRCNFYAICVHRRRNLKHTPSHPPPPHTHPIPYTKHTQNKLNLTELFIFIYYKLICLFWVAVIFQHYFVDTMAFVSGANECDSSPCLNGGSCRDGNNKYTCQCVSSFTGDRCETGTSCLFVCWLFVCLFDLLFC